MLSLSTNSACTVILILFSIIIGFRDYINYSRIKDWSNIQNADIGQPQWVSRIGIREYTPANTWRLAWDMRKWANAFVRLNTTVWRVWILDIFIGNGLVLTDWKLHKHEYVVVTCNASRGFYIKHWCYNSWEISRFRDPWISIISNNPSLKNQTNNKLWSQDLKSNLYFVLYSIISLINPFFSTSKFIFWRNYTLFTCNLFEKHFIYMWFKNWHFILLKLVSFVSYYQSLLKI